MTTATATRRSAEVESLEAEPTEAHTTAEDELLATLARTAQQPLTPRDDELVQALAEILWRRKGVRR
jgi:hypothetical protein